MDDVVALLNLVQLLERQGQFSRTGAVALEVVLVETVKNLVVGKHAQFQVLVDKALVQCAVDGLEGDVVAAVLKDVAQSLNLLGAVAQDDDAVALGQEVGERLPDEVEVLVVDALGLAVQCHAFGALLGCALAVGEGDALQPVQALDEQVGVNHLVGGLGVALVGNECAGRHPLAGNLADAHLEPLLAAAQHDGGVAHIVKQRHVVLAAARRAVVEDAHLLQALLAQLRLDVEGTYRVNVVAPEVDAVGQLVAVGEHIEDGAAHAVLARLIDVVGRRETQFAQACRQFAQVGRAAGAQLHGAGLHILAAPHTLGQRLGIGHHPPHRRVVEPAVEHLGAQDFVGGIHLSVLDVALVARREDQHLLVACQLAQVVVHVARLVQVVDDDEVGAGALGQRREQHRRAGPRQPVNHGIARAVNQLLDSRHPPLAVEYATQLPYLHACKVTHYSPNNDRKATK